jgi:hypothetical protein
MRSEENIRKKLCLSVSRFPFLNSACMRGVPVHFVLYCLYARERERERERERQRERQRMESSRTMSVFAYGYPSLLNIVPYSRLQELFQLLVMTRMPAYSINDSKINAAFALLKTMHHECAAQISTTSVRLRFVQ